MNIQYLAIKDLAFAEYNPRTMTESQFEALRLSIRKFGFVEPVVVNKTVARIDAPAGTMTILTIVGGHMRVRAAEAEGMTEVPCFVVELDYKAERALNIALNRISGAWDEQKLAEMVVKLNDEGYDLKLTGLEPAETASLISDGVLRPPVDPAEGEGEGDEKEGSGGYGKGPTVIVDCASVEEQRATYEKLKADGYIVRVGKI